MPFSIDGVSWDADVTKFEFKDLPAEFKRAKDAECIFRQFKENYTFSGYISAETYQKRLRQILSEIDPEVPILILDVPAQPEPKWGERNIQPDMLEPIQNVHRELVRERKNTWLIDPLEFVRHPSDHMDWWHFDRKVYYRIYQRIAELIATNDTPLQLGAA
jgi:hypothetical protein